MALKGNPDLWSATDRQGVIRDAIALQGSHVHVAGVRDGKRKCPTCRAAARELFDRVGFEPLVYQTRSNGRLVPMPKGKARWERFMNNVAEIHEYMASMAWTLEPSEPVEPVEASEPEISPVIAAPEPKPEPTIGLSDAHAEWFATCERLRAFAVDRGIDQITYRPIADGARMINAGIPVKACTHAMTLHWDTADRRQAGIEPYNVQRDFPGGMDAYLMALVRARVLVMIVGPAGVGKSYWVKSLRDRLNLPYASMPCTEGATPSWLLGKDTRSGFKSTRFLDIWRNGGVFLFDEIDAADPNLLMVINDALANGELFNPVDQETYVRHPKCLIFAAANTMGTGATEEFIRNQLDFSTLDRFRMGRVEHDYCPTVAQTVLAQNAAMELLEV